MNKVSKFSDNYHVVSGNKYYYPPKTNYSNMNNNINTQLNGYHIDKIEKGEYGKISKIKEELDELIDASKQQCKILQMVELSDLYGAIEAYAANLNISMADIAQMSNLTKSAFTSGKRK